MSINDPCMPRHRSSTDPINLSIYARASTVEISQLQRPQNHSPKYHRKFLAERRRTATIPLKNNNLKDLSYHHPSFHERNTHKTSEAERTSVGSQWMTVENCSSPGMSFGVESPRSWKKLFMMDSHSSQIVLLSGSCESKRQCNKKHLDKDSQNGKHKVKAKYLQLDDGQSSELSTTTRNSSCQGKEAFVNPKTVTDKSQTQNQRASP